MPGATFKLVTGAVPVSSSSRDAHTGVMLGGRDFPHSEDVMRRVFLPVALMLAAATPVRSQQPTGDSAYTITDVMIPVRDSVRLHTVILAPRGAGALPILMDRTPYGATGAAGGMAGSAAYLGLAGYIIVLQDIRG